MEDRILFVLSELVGINSISPTLASGPGEREIAEFVGHFLQEFKLDVEIQTVAPDRANVVAVVPGMDRKHSLLLNGHLDTVGIDDMAEPFRLRQEGDRLYGRGAYDMKGSLAVMLLLAEYFTQHRPPIDVLLTFVADEEDKSIGMEYIVEKWFSDISSLPIGGLFLEPTEENIGVCHKGFNWCEIEVIGKAAHGSRPYKGVDAILPLRAALDEIAGIQSELLNREADPLLGHATLHTSTIEGGTEWSTIPSRSCLRWERRTLPGEAKEGLRLELNRVIRAVENHAGNHNVNGREVFVRPPYRVSDDAEVVNQLYRVSPHSKKVGLSFWSDSALSGLAGIPSPLFGPVGHGAHAVDEWVSLKSLVRVYEVIKNLIMTF